MSTWHQDRRRLPLWHPTKWTVVFDPPGRPMAVQRCDTAEEAERVAKQQPHSYVLNPGGK